MFHQFQNLSFFTKKLPRHLLTLLFVSLLCVPTFLVGTQGAYAKALNESVLQPEKVVNGATLYNLAQVLKTPGIKVVSVTKDVLVPYKKSASALTPAVTDYLYVQAIINWTFYNGKFVCGSGTGTAWTTPGTSLVSELGDLYVNGNLKDWTDTGFIGSTTGETGCWNFGKNTLWEMYASASTQFLDGAYAYAETTVTAYQP